jgi:hypothetical protein
MKASTIAKPTIRQLPKQKRKKEMQIGMQSFGWNKNAATAMPAKPQR